MKLLHQEIEVLKEKVEDLTMKNNITKVLHYTDLSSWQLLKKLFLYITYE